MRHAKYVTKEMQVTVANVLVYKEGGETEERQIELAGYHDNVDILGHKFYDGTIVVQVLQNAYSRFYCKRGGIREGQKKQQK